MAENTAATASFPISMEAFSRLAPRQKVIGMAGVALLLAVLIGGWLWAKDPPYALLFTIQDEKDGGQIVAALSQQNIPYRFSDGGRSILVPQAVVHDTRLRLASQGLPKGGLVGFELMETQKLGVSQFAEQINYQRALEGELARSVQSLAAVRGARVHLAIPKQTAFLRDDQKASASVLVSLHPGRTLEPVQVAGIVNLVASSVPQLNPLNVSVIDQEGKLISQHRDPSRDAGLDASQLKFVREVEADYSKRIEAILAPVVGPSNVRAQVAADLDFSQIDQVAETYKPNPGPETAIRSQQTAEVGGSGAQAAGIPGALTNQPPVPATAPLTQGAGAAGGGAAGAAAANAQSISRNATINYEVDKTIRHTKGVPGTVRRLSVAVVVNHRKDPTKPKPTPLTAAELTQITNLAREAMGFNQARGDTLNVANAAFTPPEKEAVADAPIYENQKLISLLLELARYAVIAGALFWLWTRMLKPVFEKLMEPGPPRPGRAEFEVGADGMLHRARSYDEKLAETREMAKKDPKAVANMIKDWVDGGEPGR